MQPSLYAKSPQTRMLGITRRFQTLHEAAIYFDFANRRGVYVSLWLGY